MIYLRLGKEENVKVSNGYRLAAGASYVCALERPNTGDVFPLGWNVSAIDSLYTTISVDLADVPLSPGEYAFIVRDAQSGDALLNAVAQVGLYDELADAEAETEIKVIEYGRN